MHEIPAWFLIITLFCPRIGLLVAYMEHQIPLNHVPFTLDMVGAILCPRVLILIYIYENMGFNNPWFWIHLVAMILAYISATSTSSKSTSE